MRRGLTLLVALTAMAAAGLGLVLDGAYGTDEAAAQMLRGYDTVTLLLICPALLLAWRAERWGGVTSRVVVAGLLAYLGYTYLYYLLGAGFTDLLLLHAPLTTATLVAPGWTLADLPQADLDRRVALARTRVPAVVLALLAASLGGMWAWASIAWAVDGTVPEGSSLVESDTLVHLGIVLDLVLLVPLYAAAAVLLWRRQGWGFALAAVALVAGTLHQVGYVVALLFQYVADVPGAVALDPFEPVIVLLYALATAVLLRSRLHTSQ